MSNPVWPFSSPSRLATLPIQVPEKYLDPRVSFPADAGPGQIFALSETMPKVLVIPQGRWFATSAEKATLQTFVETTLSIGRLAFDWTNPWRSAGTLTFRFQVGGLPVFLPIAPPQTRSGIADQLLYSVMTTLEWRTWYPPVAVTT